MKKLFKISKLAGIVLLVATIGYGLFMKLTNAYMFDLYIEYFFRAITPLNILFWLTVVTLLIGNFPSLKESARKMTVTLKRQPSLIPLVVLAVAFVYYSGNLTKMSNTTALVYGSGMGLCQFTIMLFSVLALVCMLNAFPKRKKPNYPMIGLMFGMLAVNIYAAFHYRTKIANAVTREVSPIVISGDTNGFILEAYNMLMVYIILVGVAAALVVLMPLYSKLLKKINTSVEIEYSGDMAQIEIED